MKFLFVVSLIAVIDSNLLTLEELQIAGKLTPYSRASKFFVMGELALESFQFTGKLTPNSRVEGVGAKSVALQVHIF